VGREELAMGANVFANGMEVSGKASNHKVIASMPDVCLSPPSPPAGPIPIPYPNFAKASDTTGGSKAVKAGGKEINLKGKSKYKKSNGDEAATRSFGAGLISHSITGSVKHKAGSFDVKVEGSSVVRNLDLTTGNHMNPGDGCTTVDTAGVAPGMGDDPDCEAMKQGNDDRREDTKQTEKKTTVTHAKIERPGQDTVTVWSSSKALGKAFRNGGEGYISGLERERVKKGLSDVVDAVDRKGKQASNLCPEAREQLNKNNDGKGCYTTTSSKERPHTSHTESRILESLFAGGAPPSGTKVTLAINWNQSNPLTEEWESDDNPCERCRKLICAAQECGIEILICDKKNEPKDVESKTGKKCPQ